MKMEDTPFMTVFQRDLDGYLSDTLHELQLHKMVVSSNTVFLLLVIMPIGALTRQFTDLRSNHFASIHKYKLLLQHIPIFSLDKNDRVPRAC